MAATEFMDFTDCLHSVKSSTIFEDFVVQGKEQGQGLVSWSSGIVDDKDSNTTVCVSTVQGWRPRSDSLIFEHQMDLEKLAKVELVNIVRFLCASVIMLTVIIIIIIIICSAPTTL